MRNGSNTEAKDNKDTYPNSCLAEQTTITSAALLTVSTLSSNLLETEKVLLSCHNCLTLKLFGCHYDVSCTDATTTRIS